MMMMTVNSFILFIIIATVKGETVADKEYPEGLFTGQVNERGERHGQGRLVWKNGDVHEGGFADDRPHGNAVYTDRRGNVFRGRYENGKRADGEVEVDFADGNTFRGEFKGGKPGGFGVYEWKNGDRYEGEYLNGLKHGTGKYLWANGKRYEGGYANGKRNGFGVMFAEDGDRYEGQWKNDRPDGEGVLFFRGERVKVTWRNGKPFPEKNLQQSNPDIIRKILR